MLLAISVGNTHVTIGFTEGTRVVASSTAKTDTKKTDLEYTFDLLNALEETGINREDITGGVISSVVPQLSLIIVNVVQRLFHFTPYLVSAKKQHSLKIDIDHPTSLGANLLADAAAVKAEFGYPAVFIDMGAATSIGVLGESGAYTGGAILPGMYTSVRRLFASADGLSDLVLTGAETVLGKETLVSVNSGVLFGSASMLDGMLDKIFAELHLGESVPVVITGHIATLVLPHMKHRCILKEHLALEGLSLLYYEHEEGKK